MRVYCLRDVEPSTLERGWSAEQWEDYFNKHPEKWEELNCEIDYKLAYLESNRK